MTAASSTWLESIRRVFDALCTGIGRKVQLIVNHDGFKLDEAVSDAYFEMVSDLQARHYGTATRYTTSAFMRAKLGASLASRNAAAHMFETHVEAKAFTDLRAANFRKDQK